MKESIWDWSAPVRNLDCKRTWLLTGVFLRGLQFLWLLQAQGYSLSCLSVSVCLPLSFWSEILSWSKENFLNESFIWTSVKNYNFNTLAFLSELTSSTYDYIYIKSSIPCSKELSNHIVVSYDFILLYFDVLLLNKLELISDVLLNKTQTWNLTHLWETGYG